MGDDLNSLSTTLSTMIRQQGAELQSGLRSLSAALDRAADRIAGVLPGAAGAIAAAPSGVQPAAPAATGTGALGMVIVTNADDRPLPVRIVAGAPPAPPSGGGGGFFGSLLGGIGSLIGGIVGGVAGGISAPIVMGELIVVLGEVLVVIRELRAALRELVTLFFDRLTQAGIFPINRLIASLLIFVDVFLRLVLTYIKPVIDWLGGTISALLTWAGNAIHELTRWVGNLAGSLADWVGRLLNALSTWLSGALPAIGTFLRDLLNFIMVTVVRPQIAELLSDLVRGLAAVLSAFVDYLVVKVGNVVVEYLVNPLRSLLGKLPGVDAMPPLPLVPERDLGPSLRDAWRSVFPAGGPTPAPAAPTLTLPGFTPPPRPGATPVTIDRAQLPEYMPPRPALGDLILGASATSPAAPGGPSTPPPAAGASAAALAAPVQVNGGITVNVSAERIDADTAPATARMIAEHLMEELQRLIDRDRFRRGLPGAARA
jgi:hypothetical protein